MLRRGFMAEYTQYWKRIYAVNWIAGVTDYFTVNIWPMIMAYLIAKTTFLGSDPKTATVVGGILATLFMIGNTLGALIMADPADRWGRKKTLQGTIGLYALGCLLTGLSPTWMIMAAARFIEGLGNGGEDCARVPYVAETAPAKIRGLAIGLLQASQSVGGVLVNLSIPLILASFVDWRYAWFVGTILAFVPIILLFFVPESRRWIETVKEKKIEKPKITYSELFKPNLRKITALCTSMFTVIQIPAFGLMFWLPTYMFVERKIPYWMAGVFQASFSIAAIVGFILWGKIADAIGRKKAIYIGQPISFAAIVGLALATDPIMILIFALISNISAIGGIVYTLANELFPTSVRATGWGFTMFIGRLVTSILSGLVLPAIAVAGFGLSLAIMGFGAIALLSIPLVYLVPETAKKELEKIAGTS
jgi:MFS family permease